MVYHLTDERFIVYLHLVSSDVEIRRIRKSTSQLAQRLFQHTFPRFRLHVEPQRPSEGIAMSGHVNLGHDGHAVFACIR